MLRLLLKVSFFVWLQLTPDPAGHLSFFPFSADVTLYFLSAFFLLKTWGQVCCRISCPAGWDFASCFLWDVGDVQQWSLLLPRFWCDSERCLKRKVTRDSAP